MAFGIDDAISIGSALLGGNKASSAYQGAGQQIKFSPYNINTGFGKGMFSGKTASTELAEPYSKIVRGIMPQLASAFQATDPRIAALSGQALGAAGGAFGALGSFDPRMAAQEQYNMLEELMAPSRQRDRESLESRLLAQGRLGSTGGGESERALGEVFEQSRLQNALAAFGESRAQQGFLGNQAGMFGQLGAQLGELPFARSQSMLQTALGLEQLPVDLLRLGGSFGQAEANAAASRAPYLAEAGDITGRTIAGLGTGLSGAFGGGESGIPRTYAGSTISQNPAIWGNT